MGMLRVMCLIFALSGAASCAQTSDVSVSYTVSSPIFSQREPVMVDFIVQNNSKRSIRVDLGKYNKRNFLISVTGPDRRKSSSIRMPVREGIGATGRISVVAGASYRQRLVIQEWFKIEALGEYDVEIQLTEALKNEDGRIAFQPPKSHVSFAVVRRDPVRLEQVAASLLRDIEDSLREIQEFRPGSDAAAAESALALSHLQDPIAVPYLAKALQSSHMVEFQAIEGLKRIGTSEAADVLIKFLRAKSGNEGPYSSILATQALQHIASTTSDSALKKRIKQALDGPRA